MKHCSLFNCSFLVMMPYTRYIHTYERPCVSSHQQYEVGLWDRVPFLCWAALKERARNTAVSTCVRFESYGYNSCRLCTSISQH